MFLILFIAITRFVAIVGSEGQESCSASSKDTQDSCVSIRECPSLLSLLSKPETLGERERETLRKSQCGFVGTVPKVCCPKIPESQESPSPSSEPEIPIPPDVTRHPNLGLINKDNCGEFTETKIIPGIEARILDYPWMAIILYTIDGIEDQAKCEGSLINNRYVLTAAHCLTGLNPGVQLTGIKIGDYDLNSEIDCVEEYHQDFICADKYQKFLIESFHTHVDYREENDNRRNDIALIRIKGKVDFNANNVKPVCLPIGKQAATLGFKKVTITGWGRISEDIKIKKKVLLQAEDTIISKNECEESFKNQKIKISLYKQFCTQIRYENSVDICPGSDGSPSQHLGIVNNKFKIIQYGILTLASCDSSKKLPNIFIEVSHYLNWILDTIY